MKPSQRQLLVKVDGAFDVDAAMRVRDVVAHAVPGTSVWVDVSDARECHDAAVAVLADAAARRRSVTVGVRGLGPHHLRMLRYLGAGGASAIRTGGTGPMAKA